MILNRTDNSLSRIERNKLNNNWDLIERGVSDADWKANNALDVANALITNAFDDAALQTNIEEKLNDLEAQYAPKLTEVSKQLADIDEKTLNNQVDLFVDFGGSLDNPDNHDNIISALDYLVSVGGGTLLIPAGIIRTSPLVLNGYRNITIRGVSPSLPWNTPSTFRIISAGEVGVQLSEVAGLGYSNEVPSWSSTEIVIENLRIDGNNFVNTGLNGNFNISLRHVTVENAILDGIVMEPQTYPFIMHRVFSRNNGRHGLYVKAPFTTVYNLYDCEFSMNDGYGIYIEDGSTSTFINVLLQLNKQGGIKIEKKDPSLYTKDVFLSKLTFINLYAEENGTLLDSNANYDGNTSVKIINYNTQEGVNAGKITGLTFINCNINASRPNGFTSKAWDVSGVDVLHTLSTDIPDTSIDSAKSGTLGMRTDINTVRNDINSTFPTVKNIPYYNKQTDTKIMLGNGYLGLRGRMRELHFQLPASSIIPGQSTEMLTVNNGTKYYPLLQKGSLIGINIIKGVNPIAGTLEFRIKYGYKTLVSSGFSGYLTLSEVIRLDNSKNFISLNFPLLAYSLDASFILGVEVVASSDYNPGHNSYSDLICELFIES